MGAGAADARAARAPRGAAQAGAGEHAPHPPLARRRRRRRRREPAAAAVGALGLLPRLRGVGPVRLRAALPRVRDPLRGAAGAGQGGAALAPVRPRRRPRGAPALPRPDGDGRHRQALVEPGAGDEGRVLRHAGGVRGGGGGGQAPAPRRVPVPGLRARQQAAGDGVPARGRLDGGAGLQGREEEQAGQAAPHQPVAAVHGGLGVGGGEHRLPGAAQDALAALPHRLQAVRAAVPAQPASRAKEGAGGGVDRGADPGAKD